MTAILFLSVLVFNFYGYRLVLSCLQKENAAAIERQVDEKQYADDELVSVKTTLHLPYYTSSPAYERAYGSINIDGKDYEYVKRRVYNDTLELLCLPDKAKTGLKAAANDIAKASADGQTPAPVKKSGTTLKVALPDFCQSLKITMASVGAISKPAYLLFDTCLLPADYTSQLERPPGSMQVLS